MDRVERGWTGSEIVGSGGESELSEETSSR